MRVLTRVLIVLSSVVGCVGCDQGTKIVARHTLAPDAMHSFLGDTIRLVYAENPGAFLGLGGSLPEELRWGLLVAFVGAILAGALGVALLSKRLDGVQIVAVSILAGGGLSNLIDRLTNSGAVIDFLNVGVGGLRTGIFNVADMAIMAGMAVLIFYRRTRQEPQTKLPTS
jgi:signal peptidase II